MSASEGVADSIGHRAIREVPKSSKPAAVQKSTFGDLAPIYDRREELLIARVDLPGKVIAVAGLRNHVLADAVELLQNRVGEFQDLDGAFLAQLAQPQRVVGVELHQGARVFGRSCVRCSWADCRIPGRPRKGKRQGLLACQDVVRVLSNSRPDCRLILSSAEPKDSNEYR